MGLTCSLGQNFGLSDCDSITEIITLKKSHSEDVQILFMLHLSKVKSQVHLGLQETEGTKCILWSTHNKEFKSYHLKTSVSDTPSQMNHSVTIWDNITVKLNMCPHTVLVHLHCDCICSKMQVKMDIIAYKNMVRIQSFQLYIQRYRPTKNT